MNNSAWGQILAREPEAQRLLEQARKAGRGVGHPGRLYLYEHYKELVIKSMNLKPEEYEMMMGAIVNALRI